MLKHYALILVLIVLIIYAWDRNRRCAAPVVLEKYVVGRGSPRILLLSGTHGNEPAGTGELRRIAAELRVADRAGRLRGTVTIVPAINAPGLAAGTRTWYGIDLNRQYDTVDSTPVITRQILELCRQSDFVMDFHEGWDYHVRTPESIGSTITGTPDAAGLARNMVAALNGTIADADKKFKYVEEMYCDIKSTLACACHKLGVPYLLCETTGQRDVQPLALRQAQVRLVCNVLFDTVLLA